MQQFLYFCFLFLASFEESVESVDLGLLSVLFLWREAHPCSFQTLHPTRTSEALHWEVHMDCAGSSATHGHLLALSFCSNSFLSQ